MYDYGWYLNRHNLTPDQVDRLPAWIDARLPLFATAWDQVVSGRG